LRADDELAALAVLEGGGNADVDAELVRLVCVALANALHFAGCGVLDMCRSNIRKSYAWTSL